MVIVDMGNGIGMEVAAGAPCIDCGRFFAWLPSAFKPPDFVNEGTYHIDGDFLVAACYQCRNEKGKKPRKKRRAAAS